MKQLEKDTLLAIMKMIDSEVTSIFKDFDDELIHPEYLKGGYKVLTSLYAKVQIEYLAGRTQEKD